MKFKVGDYIIANNKGSYGVTSPGTKWYIIQIESAYKPQTLAIWQDKTLNPRFNPYWVDPQYFDLVIPKERKEPRWL